MIKNTITTSLAVMILLVLVSAAPVVLLSASAAMAQTTPAGELDAHCDEGDINNPTWRYVTGGGELAAQTFVPDRTGKILTVMVLDTSRTLTIPTEVKIITTDSSGLPTDPVKTITTDPSGLPTDPPVLASSAFSVVTEEGWYVATFAAKDAAEVVADEKYAIVFYSPTWDVTVGDAGYCGEGELYRSFDWTWYLYPQSDGTTYDMSYRTYIGNPDTVAPTGTIRINDGATRTKTRLVSLNLNAGDALPSSGVTEMRIRNDGGAWGAWVPYTNTVEWKLTRGEGKKTVYARFKDTAGNVSARASDSIIYRP